MVGKNTAALAQSGLAPRTVYFDILPLLAGIKGSNVTVKVAPDLILGS
jgi:hypothetical protein